MRKVPWGPILMKILLKKIICGSGKQCTRPTDRDVNTVERNFQLYPNPR